MLVEQGNVTALLERVEQVGEAVKFGTNSGDKTHWCGREYGEKLRKKGWSGGCWNTIADIDPSNWRLSYHLFMHNMLNSLSQSAEMIWFLSWRFISFHVLKSPKSLVHFLQQSWLHKTGRQESNQPGWLPVFPEELDGDVWDYAIRCLARLDLQRAWQLVLQGPSIQGGKVWDKLGVLQGRRTWA